MTLETYLIYVAAVAVFFATPPDTSQLLIISNSVRYGLRRSVWTIAGDLSANCIQMTGAAFGLAVVIATSASAFVAIKWMGVVYLIWIGVQLVFSKSTSSDVTHTGSGQTARLFRQGFFTSMANPFAVVFFGALFPQFIDSTAPILPQLLILGGTYIVFDGTILLMWGWAGERAAMLMKRTSLGFVNKICGSLMIMAAGLLAVKDLDPQR